MAGDDLLSALADDILRRILHFLPFKEAASTSVLSRRWGSLWRSSGAVNLAVRLNAQEPTAVFLSRRDAFVRAAKAALYAADAPVTRLTLCLEAASDGAMSAFLDRWREHWLTQFGFSCQEEAVDVMGAVFSHPAARHVEELRVDAIVGADDDNEAKPAPSPIKFDPIFWNYDLSPLLPLSETLRVLDLTRCRKVELAPPPQTARAAWFPRLETLRLRCCNMYTSDLQALIDPAPRLATTHLESILFLKAHGIYSTGGVHLRCPTTTDLVLELRGMDGEERYGQRGYIVIDAPRLRCFRYKGIQRLFSLSSPPPDMARVDLHFLPPRYSRHGDEVSPSDKDRTRALFWTFVRNFTGARALKLKVKCLEDIAVEQTSCDDDTARLMCSCTFRNAVHVELEAEHRPRTTSNKAAVAIADLLRCCPAVRDLRLKLRTAQSSRFTYGHPILEAKDRLDYDRSVHLFTRRCMLKPVLLSLELDANDIYDGPSDIPGLTGQSFACLQTSLTRVSLQFRLDNSRCLGLQLVKFFADNAQVLEEICVDSGNRKLCEHMNINVERWIAPTSSKACLKRKNLTENSWEFSNKLPRNSTCFRVLPLQR